MDIIEHVAPVVSRSHMDCGGSRIPDDAAEYMAKKIIRATIEHLRDNVSDRTVLAGLEAGSFANEEYAMKQEFTAMLSQALKELNAGRDEQ